MIKNAKLMHSSPSPGILGTQNVTKGMEYPNNLNKDGGTHFIQSLHGLMYMPISIYHTSE